MSRSTEFQRALDRYLGDPIAVLCSVRRPVATGMANPVRIGLIQPTAIGDLIIASGLIAHIRAKFPVAEIHLLHGRSNRSALDLLEPGIIGRTLDFTKPIATPATGAFKGTPASIRESDAPQIVAMDDDPFDSRMSETTRMA